MHDVIVVGGGISGLAAAFWLRQKQFDVLVLEANDEVGGTMRSQGAEGFLFERGPNSFLDNRETTARLLDHAALRPLLQVADAAAKKRYLYRQDTLREVPTHPLRLFQSGLMSKRGIARMFAEPFVPRRGAREDESLADFMDRRIGREAREILVDAFVGGIYAGASSELNAEASFPSLVDAENKYGSIVLGLLAGGASGKRGASVYSCIDGMGALPKELAVRVGNERVQTGAAVQRISSAPGEGYQIEYVREEKEESASARAVIVATPAHDAARLLQDLLTVDARKALTNIPYAPVAVAGVGLPESAFPKGAPEGFGFLIPPTEGLRILGCIYSSALFPNRAPDGQVALTIFVGGANKKEEALLGDSDLQALVMKDLETTLGVSEPPSCFLIQRWKKAIPQYTAGHLQRRACIEEALKAQPGLYCAGNYLHGISVHDAIETGSQAAEQILSYMGSESIP